MNRHISLLGWDCEWFQRSMRTGVRPDGEAPKALFCRSPKRCAGCWAADREVGTPVVMQILQCWPTAANADIVNLEVLQASSGGASYTGAPGSLQTQGLPWWPVPEALAYLVNWAPGR
jgi:hypothetical protein